MSAGLRWVWLTRPETRLLGWARNVSQDMDRIRRGGGTTSERVPGEI